MRIESLKLNDFRNYEQLDLSFSPGTNLFYGDNAQGKTNVLEAVYLCGTTKSHRAGKDREMIRFDRDEAHIRMELIKNGINYRIDMHLKKNRAKGIAVNGVPIHRASELIGIGNFVFFSPEDMAIIKNGPGERRRFMDMELCQLEKLYVHNLADYNRVLLQRNKLLKDLIFHPDYAETLDIWDEQLVRTGMSLIRAREKFVSGLNGIIGEIHGRLSGGKEKLEIFYEKDVEADSFAEVLKAGRERDLRLKTTGCGPHRDDLRFMGNDTDLRKYGSQGQQRTTALSLKLSEIEMVKQVSGDIPVLLLDDVLSELDKGRQRFLLDSIRDIQTLITCTGTDDFVENAFQIDRLFYVESGIIDLKQSADQKMIADPMITEK